MVRDEEMNDGDSVIGAGEEGGVAKNDDVLGLDGIGTGTNFEGGVCGRSEKVDAELVDDDNEGESIIE